MQLMVRIQNQFIYLFDCGFTTEGPSPQQAFPGQKSWRGHMDR